MFDQYTPSAEGLEVKTQSGCLLLVWLLFEVVWILLLVLLLFLILFQKFQYHDICHIILFQYGKKGLYWLSSKNKLEFLYANPILIVHYLLNLNAGDRKCDKKVI